MLPDRVSNPGPLTYESGALPIALRDLADNSLPCLSWQSVNTGNLKCETEDLLGDQLFEKVTFPGQSYFLCILLCSERLRAAPHEQFLLY